MALTLIRFFETKTPLLPIFAPDKHPTPPTPTPTQTQASANMMPASTQDYILLYTETGELTLRPVAISIASHIR
jgi:hypothetical protein